MKRKRRKRRKYSSMELNEGDVKKKKRNGTKKKRYEK